MPYTATNLITDAYYASGVVSRDFETVSGPQIGWGLQWLNEILADKTVENDMLQYYKTDYNWVSIIGQEKYFIPNLISVSSLTFFIDTVRYPMQEIDRNKYFGSARANNIESLPTTYHVESCFGGCNIFLYFLPQQPYVMQLTGLFRIPPVTLNQDLQANFTSGNLGTPTITGAGNLSAGQLVINGVDLAGNYANANLLVAYINTGIIPGVTAGIVGTEFNLRTSTQNSISVVTLGTQTFTNNITFSNFSTLNGPINTGFMGQSLEIFYTTYLKYALARRICTEYDIGIPPPVVDQLKIYQQYISNNSATLDLNMVKISTFDSNSLVNYAQANLGKGWLP